MAKKANRYDSTRQWYAIHTYSGHEEKVAEGIRQRINSVQMADKIFDVIVPKEKQIEIKNGKRKVIDKKIFQVQNAASRPERLKSLPEIKSQHAGEG